MMGFQSNREIGLVLLNTKKQDLLKKTRPISRFDWKP